MSTYMDWSGSIQKKLRIRNLWLASWFSSLMPEIYFKSIKIIICRNSKFRIWDLGFFFCESIWWSAQLLNNFLHKSELSNYFGEMKTWTRVSVQGVKSLGGHFACLCRGFEFYEVRKKKFDITPKWFNSLDTNSNLDSFWKLCFRKFINHFFL